jgi:hypothetical protein
MDPRTIEINNLRVLNDYLNQTIDVLLRTQRIGATPVSAGLSHSPYATPSFFGTPFAGGAGIGIDPTLSSLSHSPYGVGSPFFSPLSATASYPPFVDPFSAQRGLSHSPVVSSLWQSFTSPVAELARQQQLAHAIAARQQAEAMMARAWGVGLV